MTRPSPGTAVVEDKHLYLLPANERPAFCPAAVEPLIRSLGCLTIRARARARSLVHCVPQPATDDRRCKQDSARRKLFGRLIKQLPPPKTATTTTTTRLAAVQSIHESRTMISRASTKGETRRRLIVTDERPMGRLPGAVGRRASCRRRRAIQRAHTPKHDKG